MAKSKCILTECRYRLRTRKPGCKIFQEHKYVNSDVLAELAGEIQWCIDCGDTVVVYDSLRGREIKQSELVKILKL